MPYLQVPNFETELTALANAFPDMCTLAFCPKTTSGGKRVPYIKITHPSSPPVTRTAVLFIGGVHAREWAPPDALVSFAKVFLNKAVGLGPVRPAQVVTYPPLQRPDQTPPVNYPGQRIAISAVQSILDSLDIYIAPLVNPDGRQFSQTTPVASNNMWRKNRAFVGPRPPCVDTFGVDLSVGVDINRNFRVAWKLEDYYDPAEIAGDKVRTALDPCGSGAINGADYRGPSAESEAETQNVVALMETISKATYFVDVHSAGPDILYSWGTANSQSPNKAQNYQNPAFNHLRTTGAGATYGEYIEAPLLSRSRTLAGRMAAGIAKMASPDLRAVPDSGLESTYTVQPSVGLYPTTGISTDRHLAQHYRTLTAAPFDAQPVAPDRYPFTIECGSDKERKFWPTFDTMFPKIEREVHLALWSLLSFAASPVAGGSLFPVETTP